jgi:ribosomal protein L17
LTSTEIRRTEVTRAVAQAGRVGQATLVEQSRAIAEVQAAVVMAKEFPRDIAAAIVEMERSCAEPELAQQAFYAMPRGGDTVTGPTVHLARELARIWGNIDYGVRELRRDDDHGQSEMQAIAWDLQANNRVSAVFIVPHAKYVRKQVEKLVDLQAIYENNANNGARRLRESIFSVLPKAFVTKAEAICRETLRRGAGEPLAERAAKAVAMFKAGRVSLDRLEAKIGRAQAEWTEDDVVQLGIDYQTIKRGEAKASEIYPPVDTAPAAADGIKAQAARQQPATEQPAASAAQAPRAEDGTPDGSAEPASQAQLKRLHTLLTKLEVKTETKHADVSTLLGREITSTKDLTAAEAETVIAKLDDLSKEEDPVTALDYVLGILREQAAEQQGGES